MDRAAHADLVDRVVRGLAAAAGTDWVRVDLEWSQAGSRHSGRAHVLDAHAVSPRLLLLPEGVVVALAALRSGMAEPGTGAWLSVHVALESGSGASDVSFNHYRRPYWNSRTASMLDAPDEPPVPSDQQWLADLRRYPRDRAHALPWLQVDAVEGEEVARLRAALDGHGHPRRGVVLPGDDPDTAFEGRLHLVRHSARHYAVQLEDFGQHEFLAEFFTEREACQMVWQYLTSPLPPPARMTTAELASRAHAASASYGDLSARLRRAGHGGMITNLAPGVPYDRIGGLDGLYFFAWNTPWEQRSLPPSAGGQGAERVTFVAVRPVEVQAELAPPWFGQPGGGIRFHVEGRARGVRDLVRTGDLRLVEVVG